MKMMKPEDTLYNFVLKIYKNNEMEAETSFGVEPCKFGTTET